MKRIRKNSIIICFALILGFIFFSGDVNAELRGVTVSSFTDLKNYLELNDGNEYHIYVQANIPITETIKVRGTKRLIGNLNGTSNSKATIGNYLTSHPSGNPNSMLITSAGANLTLDKMIFDGRNVNTVASSNVSVDAGTVTVIDCNFHTGDQGIHVGRDGTLYFKSGVIHNDNTSMGIGAFGTVYFQGGTIQGSGQGIHINGTYNTGRSILYMSGGTIQNCTTGVLIFNNSTGNISGGTIQNCTTGVYNRSKTVNISGGTITGNTNGFNNEGTGNVSNGTIKNNSRGIYNTGTLTVTGGTIESNTAADGSAIYHNGSSCTITGGTFGSNQNVYLAANDKYVNTNSSYPTFVVKPNTYTRGRKVIQTTNSTYATGELNYASLYPSDGWYLRARNSEIDLWDKSKITINYHDINGTEIAESVESTDWVNESITTTALDITGYTLKTTPSTQTLNYQDNDTEFTFEYYQNSGTVNVKYKDYYSDQEISTEANINGYVGDTYSTVQRDINGYTFYSSVGQTSGELTTSDLSVTYYYKKNVTLTIRYIDVATGNPLLTDVIQNKLQGDSYSTASESITDYTLVSIPDNATGTMGDSDVIVTYNYRLNSGLVTVKYIDEYTNNEISTEDTFSGSVGDSYTVNAKNISGYTLSSNSNSYSGNYTSENVTITFKYKKNVKVIVSYIDEYTNTNIINSTEQNKLQGDNYSTTAEEITGYTLVTTPQNASGTIGADDVNVVYGYRQNSAQVIAKYVDYYTNSDISSEVVSSGYVGDTYSTTQKNINGYTFFEVTGATTGNYSLSNISVTYKYKKQVQLITKFVNELNDEEISEQLIENKLQGDSYETIAKSVSGYVVTSQPDNATGTMGSENTIVIYKYTKISGGVDVRYIDQVTDREIANSEHIDGNEGDSYTSTPKDITGYELVKSPENPTGVMGEDLITLTYEYRKLSNVTAE